MDERNPDWAPSRNLGHTKLSQNNAVTIARYQRSQAREEARRAAVNLDAVSLDAGITDQGLGEETNVSENGMDITNATDPGEEAFVLAGEGILPQQPLAEKNGKF